jgi:hypothetical protein
MPLYFFHLSFGDRLARDEEGAELPSRAAALREAFAVARDLSDPSIGGDPRRWAGWFLQVADERGTILRAPIGYPALQVAGKEAAAERPDHLQFEPTPRRKQANRPNSRLAAVARQLLLQRKRTADLLEWNRRLRHELSGQMLAAERAWTYARRLVAGERGIEPAIAFHFDSGAATKRTGHKRPHLVLLQGGR